MTKVVLEQEQLAELAYLFENLPRISNPTTDRIITIINSGIQEEPKPEGIPNLPTPEPKDGIDFDVVKEIIENEKPITSTNSN